ncbi:MAG: hypothetical protein E6I92_06950 [Chloroflexi bacterium]|nr:MAG: hypothetical protein E6I92_06950 [Chloroflexota bacterium]
MGALPEERRRDVADAHHLGHGHAEDPLDVIANLRDAAARFAAGDHVGEARPALTPTLSR